MARKIPSFTLFALGFLSGILLYWLIDISLISRAENATHVFRIVASSSIHNCDQILKIENSSNINIRCKVETEKQHRGVKYKVRSTVQVQKDDTGNTATVTIENKLKKTQNKKKILTILLKRITARTVLTRSL